MTTYHQEKVQNALSQVLECLARDPTRAERLLGDVKKWSAEAELEAYARGKADAEVSIAEKLRAYADRQYCLGLEKFRQTDCLGWEYKAKNGKFGPNEYYAHERANRFLGAHFGIYGALDSLKHGA